MYNNNCGYSLGNFILLYFIGAYLRKYPIEKSRFFLNVSNSARRLIFLCLFFLIAFVSSTIEISAREFVSLGSIMNYIGTTITNSFTAYDNPLLIIQTVLYFLFFSTLNIKSKFINNVASCTLGIYLIHDNPHVIEYIFKLFKINVLTSYNSSIFIKLFIVAVALFIICYIIEFIRQKVFKYVYNRKISIRFRNWYQNYTKKLGIQINW